MQNKYYEELVAEVKADFAKRREDRKSLELQWRLNINYLIGNQFAEITSKGDIEDYGKQYFWQEREVYNHISIIIDTRLSKLNNLKSGMSVRPLTTDESDKQAALFATRIFGAVISECDLKSAIATANMWSETTGTAFYKIVWNDKAGKRLGTDKKGRDLFEGDVEVRVCPPFEIYPDSLANANIEDCRSIIQARAYSVEEVKDIWGVDIEGESIDVFSLDAAATLGGLGYSASARRLTNSVKENHTVVIERYEKPSGELPEGRLVIVAGDKLLYSGELPYANGAAEARTYPFIKQCSIVTPGSFFGTSVIERLIPIQRAYNIVKNRKHEYMNRIAMGVLAVEDGSIDIDNLEEEGLSPGKILVFRQGSTPPVALELGRVPPDFHKEENALLQEFASISGISDLMKYSDIPDGVTSGAALSLLIDQDDSRLNATAIEIRAALLNAARQIIRLYKQFAIAPRLRRLAGDSGDIEMRYFSANDFTSDDVVFDSESELIESPLSRKNKIIDILRLGLLNDENGTLNEQKKNKVLEILGFGNWESGRDFEELHVKKAKRENETMKKEDAQPSDLDNHELHIAEHIRAYLVGERRMKKEMKERFLTHVATHRRMLKIERRLSDNENIKSVKRD